MTILKHVLGTYIRKHVSTHISCSVLVLEEEGGKKGETRWGKKRLGGKRREKQERDGKDQGEGEGKIGGGKDRVRRGQ